MMELCHRMLKMFHVSISTAFRQPWSPIQNPSEDALRMTTHSYCTRRGHTHGTVLSAVYTAWIPFSHHQVFEFLRSEKNGSKLETFSGGGDFQEISRFGTGAHPGSSISLLRINSPSNPDGPSKDLMVQENYVDPLGSVICFAPIAVGVVDTIMTSGDTSHVPLLPCGILVLPAAKSVTTTAGHNSQTSGAPTSADTASSSATEVVYTSGCVLTVAFQVLASASPSTTISMSTVSAVHSHICTAVRQIQDALAGSSAGGFSPPAV